MLRIAERTDREGLMLVRLGFSWKEQAIADQQWSEFVASRQCWMIFRILHSSGLFEHPLQVQGLS